MSGQNNKLGSTSERLPSFKGPRDLSLSSRGGKKDSPSASSAPPIAPIQGKSRRVFTPNIPPRRDRSSGPSNVASPASKPSARESSKPTPHNERGRGRGQSGRGGQRGGARQFKPRGELLQSESIFGEGMGDPLAAKRSAAAKSGYGGSRYKSAESGPSKMSSLNRSTLKTIIKEEDTESNKKIFGNEKFDEDQEDNDVSDPNIPVTVPLVSYIPEVFLEATVLIPSDNTSIPVPVESLPETSVASRTEPGTITIKQEKIDDDDEVQALPGTIFTSIKAEDPESEEIRKNNEVQMLAAMSLEPASFAGTFRSIPPEGTLAVFQLPDELPVLNDSVRDAETQSTEKSSTGLVQSIDDLPDGLIGKIEILSSGRTRFVLGENVFDVEPGRLVGFRQECHAANMENKTLTNLGPINRKFVITPDITYLITD